MRAASAQPRSYTDRPSLRRRAVALAVAVGINLLLVLMLLRLAPYTPNMPALARKISTFQLLPEREEAQRTETKQKTAKRTQEAAAAAPARAPAPVPVPPVKQPSEETNPPPLNMLILSREDFAATDVGKIRSSRPDAAGRGDAGTSGAGQQSASAESGGGSPPGDKLYPADWYRRPSSAELSTYLPPNAPDGWGLIACQTVERFHVDNCRELGDSPPGSGLARAVRQAAWQFLVWPPRINGKPMVGAWVSIRIDYTHGRGTPRD